LNRVTEFIKEHHLLSLSTCKENQPHSANCFYAFDADKLVFVIASDKSTRHIKELNQNPNYSATIALETLKVGDIRGIQFSGTIKKANIREKALYLKTFPFALALNPTLWSLHVKHLKFTDNRLGFGKKLEFDFTKRINIIPSEKQTIFSKV